jgi:hypothetical protein
MSIYSIDDHKSKKIYQRLIEDIDKILHVISLTQKSLSHFKQYIPVQKIISILETNKTLLEIHRNNNEDELEKIEKKYTEQSSSET